MSERALPCPVYITAYCLAASGGRPVGAQSVLSACCVFVSAPAAAAAAKKKKNHRAENDNKKVSP